MRKCIITVMVFLSAFILISCKSSNKEKKEPEFNFSEFIKEDSIKTAYFTKKFKNRYEIVGTNHNKAVGNFYVLINDISINKDTLQEFASAFRSINNYRKSNLNIIDNKDIYPLVKEYPLQGKDYLKVADHLVGTSSFDSPEQVILYPYQDIYYKEQGGKNWKVKKID